MNRLWVSSGALALLMAASLSALSFLDAQSSKSDSKTTSTKGLTVPRMPDCHPDLHGYWTSLSVTPLERPAKYGNREFLTEQETQDAFNAGVQHEFEGTGASGDAENDPESADYDSKRMV